MSPEEIKKLIKEELKEHLNIKVETKQEYFGDTKFINITVLYDDEIIDQQSEQI
jgi:hypothetical protein